MNILKAFVLLMALFFTILFMNGWLRGLKGQITLNTAQFSGIAFFVCLLWAAFYLLTLNN